MQTKNTAIFTVSVGIPAFNEEANIGYLLNDLLGQNEEGYQLEKIYVYSDGSTDKTESIVRGVKDARIELISGPGRKGAAHGQNIMMDLSTSDSLVLLNADIQLKNQYLIREMITPLINDEAELTSVKHRPLIAKNFYEKALMTSVELKDILFESYRNGSNVYTCRGGARAMSKRLYTEMRFIKSVGEDAYSYLYCLAHGYTYRYIADTAIYYRLSDNFSDHQKQSTRFFKGKNNFGEVFGEDFVQAQMSIPLGVYIKATLKALPIIIQKPITTVAYVCIVALLRAQSFFGKDTLETWEIAMSSKKLQ